VNFILCSAHKFEFRLDIYYHVKRAGRWKLTYSCHRLMSFSPQNICTGVGKSRFTFVRMEKDMRVMIITIAYKYEIITIILIIVRK